MKVSSLYCNCNGRGNALDHYASGECPSPPMPLPWIAAILVRNAEDKHGGNRITATRVLTCPRQVAIEDNLPSMLDVRQLNSPFVGTAVHNVMEEYSPGEFVEIPLKGRLFGVEMEGTLDKLRPDGKAIEDYKFHGETAQNFKFSSTVDPELAAQLNIYRLLREQDPKVPRIERLGVWHGAIVSARSKAPAWFYRNVPFLSEEEILRIKPNGAAYSVGQIVGLLTQFRDALGAGGGTTEDGLRALVHAIPLVGREMWRGKKCTDYCPVKRTCDELEGLVAI